MVTKVKRNLVIVESPAKAKTIERYLGKNYKVVASLGHIRDLPKSQMGVDIDNNYTPKYISIRGKGDIIKKLKRDAKNAKNIYLASDPDREGEAIAWHVGYILGLDPNEKHRVVFNEITKDAVKKAFKSPRSIDMNLVNAQQARRILDRLVGYSISPILWKKIKKGLSAGRVQSVALKLIIDREKEIKNFNPEEYWTIDAEFKKDNKNFLANFYSVNDTRKQLHNNKDVDFILNKIEINKSFTVTNVIKKERQRFPAAPFTTSSMQQEANRKLKFKTRKTMMIAQQLYEGINLGSKLGTVGLITYMRTDSTRISKIAKKDTKDFINKFYGEEYTTKNSRVFKKSEGSQDAHEAIRPTFINKTPKELKKFLTNDQYKLYDLIWSRFLASQMSAAVYDTVKITLKQNDITFYATGSKKKFPGFTKVYISSREEKIKDNSLPTVSKGDKFNISNINSLQHFTQPPTRYSEANLVKALEENGVGRPSTYSPTIETIQKRYYVKLNSRKLESTELGDIVNNLIGHFFPEIVNIDFTANLEHQLDEVEVGKINWVQVVNDFYKPFSLEVSSAETKIEKVQIKDTPAGFDCDICGAPMVIKMGRFGKFYACSRFPKCHNTKPIVKKLDVICPKCNKGQIVERKSKKNRIFYGCDRYPECDFVSWDKPVGRNCPRCNHYLVEKKFRGKSKVVCPDCGYEEEI